MKHLLVLGALSLFTAVNAASAQTLTSLDIRTYAGLTITGAVTTVYSIQYVPDLALTNNASAWRCLEFLQLPSSPYLPYLWADRSTPATGKRFYRAVQFEASTNMVFIPPGTFRMGSPSNEVDRSFWEGPQPDVTITRGFWMGKYEVTQGEYLALMGKNPSYFNTNYGFGLDLTRPVESVGRNDATNYCALLTQKELAAGAIPQGTEYRLPTSAEWEYACRAWTSTRFSYGDDPSYQDLANYAWYSVNAQNKTHPVGQKLPNQWGLYDMAGNVLEYCADDFNQGGLPGGILIDPVWPDSQFPIVRGGAFNTPGSPCRSAYFTSSDSLSYGHFMIGFRIVLAVSEH